MEGRSTEMVGEKARSPRQHAYRPLVVRPKFGSSENVNEKWTTRVASAREIDIKRLQSRVVPSHESPIVFPFVVVVFRFTLRTDKVDPHSPRLISILTIWSASVRIRLTSLERRVRRLSGPSRIWTD